MITKYGNGLHNKMSIHFVNMTVTTATYRRQLPKAYENMFLNLSLRLLTINIYLTYLKKF